jgi:hypothetical protein
MNANLNECYNNSVVLCAYWQAQLDEKLDNIRGAVTMGYPQGLPPFDPVRLAIEGDKAGTG